MNVSRRKLFKVFGVGAAAAAAAAIVPAHVAKAVPKAVKRVTIRHGLPKPGYRPADLQRIVDILNEPNETLAEMKFKKGD